MHIIEINGPWLPCYVKKNIPAIDLLFLINHGFPLMDVDGFWWMLMVCFGCFMDVAECWWFMEAFLQWPNGRSKLKPIGGFPAPDFSVAKACPMMETVAFTEYLAEDGSLGAVKRKCALYTQKSQVFGTCGNPINLYFHDWWLDLHIIMYYIYIHICDWSIAHVWRGLVCQDGY